MAHVVLKDLVKTYGSFYAVNNVSLTVNDGVNHGAAGDTEIGGRPVVRPMAAAMSSASTPSARRSGRRAKKRQSVAATPPSTGTP